jgi:hypothetical protein
MLANLFGIVPLVVHQAYQSGHGISTMGFVRVHDHSEYTWDYLR